MTNLLNDYKSALLLANDVSFHENFNKNNIIVLKELGFKVFIAANFENGTISKKRLEKFYGFCKDNDISIIKIKVPRNPINVIRLTKSYIKLRNLVNLIQFDLIHSHTPVGGLLGRLVSIKTKTYNLYTAHGFHFYIGSSILNWFLYFPVEKFLSLFTDVIVTINSEDFLLSNKFLNARTVYIPGVGIDDTSVPHKINNSFNKIPIITSVGELNNNKNHKLIIKTLARINHDFLYLIVGDGKNKNKLSKLILKKNLRNKIKLVGYINDISEILKNTDIFISSSIREGLPRSVMEAMAVGIPIIASDIRGHRDLVINNKGGYLFDLQNKENLFESINKLLEDRSLIRDMGLFNIQYIKKFGDIVVMNALSDLYKKHYQNE